ncbi:MAG: hypothetical protein M0D55_20300 [Elusimicrobiota bacterium]|nr:MAG: hypothetical protein M0D55_20300 [Elusimicrobiota bacterium]
MILSAALGAWLAASASAAKAPVLPDMATSKSTPGWSRQGKSLVLYDAEGSLSFEVGLLKEDSGATTREVEGKPSPTGARRTCSSASSSTAPRARPSWSRGAA